MLNRPLPAPARDTALMIGRVVLGVVLFAHGWQKVVVDGIAGTTGQFEKLGIPLAIVSASFTSCVEFVGGALLIAGALTTAVIALDLVVMVGAAGFVSLTHGVLAQAGGWELVWMIVAAELVLVANGPGRFSVDHLIASRRVPEPAPRELVLYPIPEPDHGTFGPAPASASPRMGIAAQFTRLSPDETGPIAVGGPRPRLNPPTAPLPTVDQEAALTQLASRPAAAVRAEPRQVTVAELVAAPVSEPAVKAASVAAPAPADPPVAATREPVAVAPLFEPRRPLPNAEPAFGPRRPFPAPRTATTPRPPTPAIAAQRSAELPQRARHTERVGP